MKHDNKVFEVKLGVSNFQPEEIEVKINEQDRMLVINAKHEEKRDDHGFISRQFSRQIYIPEVSLSGLKGAISEFDISPSLIKLWIKQLNKPIQCEIVRFTL